jgi:two-component system, chemotaxis family, chemotaxis protein CheY
MSSYKNYAFDPKLSVLVVDDQQFIRNMVKAILKSIGINNIECADDGDRAIQMLNTDYFDLVICDWNMPTIEGIDVLRHLRKIPHGGKTLFIMLTAEAYRENIVQALEAGVNDYISKPFTPDILGEKVAKAIEKAARKNS